MPDRVGEEHALLGYVVQYITVLVQLPNLFIKAVRTRLTAGVRKLRRKPNHQTNLRCLTPGYSSFVAQLGP